MLIENACSFSVNIIMFVSKCFCLFSIYALCDDIVVVPSGRGPAYSGVWTHTLRPFYNRPIALSQEMRSQVDDVCECVRD